MTHVHTPQDGACGNCGWLSGADCPMVYCPGCPPGCDAVDRYSTVTGPAQQVTLGTPIDHLVAPKPALGRVVHILVDPSINNGSDVAPALITRVWPTAHDKVEPMVNLRVLLDGTNHSHEWATSRYLWATEGAARAADEAAPSSGPVTRHAFWPPRV